MLLPKSPWSKNTDDVLLELNTLDIADAQNRHRQFGPNALSEEEHSKAAIFLNQFASPIVLILVAAAVIPPSAEILGYILIASLGIFILAEGYKWVEYLQKRS